MPLSFLNPGLLVGLVAAAVPVIIHFLSRRRLRRVAFSDLRFLQEEESQQARRRGLRRWLLLLLRVLIIACLVLAAARPHWGGLPGGGGRAALFVIDASASMQAQQDDGRRRFDAAVAEVGAMIGGLPADASVQVVLAGPTAVPLFATWLPAGAAAKAALSAAQVTDGACDLGAALRQAAELVAEAPASPVELVLLSDLQAGPQPGLADAVAGLAATGTRVLVRGLGDGLPPGAVLDVALPERALQPGETITVAATVRPDRPDQAFWLEIDGRRVAETVAGAPPAELGTVNLDFTVTAPAAGLHTGRVGKDADRLPVDDTRPFVLDVPERLAVLLAHGEDRDGLGRGGWRYLERALAPDAVTAGLFSVRSLPVDSLLEVGLDAADLLVLVDAGAPGRRLAGTLRPWLEAGGALMVLAGDPAQEQDLRGGILPLLDLPPEAAWTARADDQPERARLVDAGHPLLADLGPAAAEALTAARWWRYFAIDEGQAQVILAADGGAPLLLEGRLGRGRWLLAPFHLRRDATDLMLNPVFLPLMQRAAAGLVAGGGRVRTLAVGEEPVLPVAASRLGLQPGDSATDLSVRVPPDGASAVVDLRWQAAGPALVAPTTGRSGIYAFTARDDTLGLIAATIPAAELQPTVETSGAVAARLQDAGLARVSELGGDPATGFSRALAGRSLARWLLAAALVLMALELWIGRRVS
ncbi:MAG: BatA and WFA domain-containing protein [Candidatus Krumholzibacteriia bacterium]